MSRRFVPFRAWVRLSLFGGVMFCAPLPALADSLLLSDGTRYEGQITKATDGWDVTLANGKRVHVAREQVVGFDVGSRNTAQAAEQQLASLRRAVGNLSDLQKIVDRYRDFAKANAGTVVGKQAETDLALWEERLERKLIKVGDKWVTEDERKDLAEKSFHTAGQAMELVRQSRINEATAVVDQAINENVQNPAAWFLRGLLLWKQDKAPEARKAFEQVVALAADNAAGHNNLAIVLWRQNQHVAALLSYDRALLAAPQSHVILDNLAEALNALEPELRNGVNVKKVVRHFNDQDTLLQQAMVAQGLYRWGSTWVTRTDYEKLKLLEKEIRDRIDRMEADYNALTARIRRMDGDIATVENTLRRMESESFGVDVNGRLIRYPLPPSYYTYLRDLGAMKADRDQRIAEQEQMRRQARQLLQGIPTPRYTGAQRMIEVEGTPVIGKAAAANAANALPRGVAPPVAPAPAAVNPPAVNPPAAPPANPPAPPVAPIDPPIGTIPPVPAPPPPALPDWPRKPSVPPEKPSILDRRLSEPPPADLERPLLDQR